MAQRHAHVAQYRRIGEIALPARDGQLVGHVSEQGIGHAAAVVDDLDAIPHLDVAVIVLGDLHLLAVVFLHRYLDPAP